MNHPKIQKSTFFLGLAILAGGVLVETGPLQANDRAVRMIARLDGWLPVAEDYDELPCGCESPRRAFFLPPHQGCWERYPHRGGKYKYKYQDPFVKYEEKYQDGEYEYKYKGPYGKYKEKFKDGEYEYEYDD